MKKAMPEEISGADLGHAMPSVTNDKSTMESDPDHETMQNLHHIVKAHAIMSDPGKAQAVHELVGRHNKAVKSLKVPKMKNMQDVKDYTQKTYGQPGGMVKDKDQDKM